MHEAYIRFHVIVTKLQIFSFTFHHLRNHYKCAMTTKDVAKRNCYKFNLNFLYN